MRAGIVPVITLSDSRKYCSFVKEPKLEGIVPASNRFEFIFNVNNSVRLPRDDGKEPLIEFSLITSDVNDISLPIDEDKVPTSLRDPIFN